MDNLNTKTNDELLQIIKEGIAIHPESVLMEVEILLMERDVQYTTAIKQPRDNRSKSVVIDLTDEEKQLRRSVFIPIAVGCGILVTTYVLGNKIRTMNGLDYNQVYYFSIGFLIVQRIIVLSVLTHFNKKLEIANSFWFLLGIIFGTWTLFAYNVYLWVSSSKKAQTN